MEKLKQEVFMGDDSHDFSAGETDDCGEEDTE